MDSNLVQEVARWAQVAWVSGFLMIAWAGLFRRVPGAPPVGAKSPGRRFRMPWHERGWFTPQGYRLRVLGSILCGIGLLGTIATVVLRLSD